MHNAGDAARTATAVATAAGERRLDIKFISAARLPWLTSARLRLWKRRTFGRTWMVLAAAEWHVLGSLRHHSVAALEIATRDADVSGVPVRLGCIGAVRTHKGYRRRGLGRNLVQQATRHIDVGLRCDFAFLMCDEPTSAFYTRCGFIRVPNPLVFDQPGGRVQSDLVVMVAPCRSTDFPSGLLDLCGLPF